MLKMREPQPNQSALAQPLDNEQKQPVIAADNYD
jgi:hypothetical protein